MIRRSKLFPRISFSNEIDLYSRNEDISKSAVINELAERMINLGYVEENFKEDQNYSLGSHFQMKLIFE